MPRRCLAALMALLLASTAPARGDGGSDLLQQYDLMVLAGDLSRAGALFDAAGTRGLSGQEQALIAKFDRRFAERPPGAASSHEPGFLGAVVAAYRDYWRSGLMGDDDAEHVLRAALGSALSRESGLPVNEGNPYPALRSALELQGLHHDERPGPPLRDLLIWREERRARFSVQLTDRTLHLAVRLLDGIELQGWKDYASLGRLSTTGWVHDGELYCLADAYDLSSEAFRVSLLKHEARHLADLEQFPYLEADELEYRAKLTELVFALRTTRSLLKKFSTTASADGPSPHARANWRVVRDVYRELRGQEMPAGYANWDEVEGAVISRAARRLLERDTSRLRAESAVSGPENRS